MASGSQLMTTYYAKRIVGDASAAQANSALLQTGANVTADTWILNRTNRATTYGIKYIYDTTTTTVHNDENDEDITTNNGQDKIEFYGGSATASAWIQLNTGDTYISGKMGIGGTDDSYKLYVNGSARIDSLLTLYREGSTTDNKGTGIRFENKDTTTNQVQTAGKTYILAYNTHSADDNGMNMVIRPGGNLFIGGGESAEHLYGLNTTSTTENLYATADSTIYLEAGAQTIANRIGIAIDDDGTIIPVKAEADNNNAQNIGTNATRWKTGYFSTSLLVGAANGVTAYNSDATGSFIDTGTISSCLTAAGGGYYLFANGKQYGRMYISAIGTANHDENYATRGAQGYTTLQLGNSTPRPAAGTEGGADNSRGRIYLYHTDDTSTVIYSDSWNGHNLTVVGPTSDEANTTGDTWLILGNNKKKSAAEASTTGRIRIFGDEQYYHNIYPGAPTSNHTHYLPDAGGWIVTGGNGTSTGEGDSNTPVYLKTDGTLEAITSYDGNSATATALTSNAGGTEWPIYFTGGKPTATSYALKATVNNGTTAYLAYYAGARAISAWSAAKFHDGCLSLFPTSSNYREGLRIHAVSNWSDITLCGTDLTGDTGISANSWFIGNNNGNFYIARNGSPGSTAWLECVNNIWSTMNPLWIKGGSTEAGGNVNRLTTSSGMPGNMQYNTSRRGTQIYSNGIAFADPYNGNSNNDAGWIRHQETSVNAGELEIAVGDDGDETIVVRQYNTSNNVARRMYLLNSEGFTSVSNQSTDSSYAHAAMQIREANYAGASSDTWGVAPRLAWHWSGRVAAQIGLASNGWLYEAPSTGTNFYKIVCETGTWGINVTGSAGSVAWGNVSSKPATATRWPAWSEVTSKPNVCTTDTAQTITGTKSWGTSGAGGQLNGAATNGGINSIRVGDDVWLGDCNVGGIMGMKSTGANTGFYFYNSSSAQTGQLYADGTYIVINKGLRIASTTGIYYTGTKATYRMIRFIDNTSDTYGNGISIGGGGQTIIGGGESSDTAAAQAGTGGSEIMWICNDGAIEFYPNLQSGWTTSYKNYINTSGHFYSVAVHSAIWNDYAECRQSDFNEAGYVITPSSNGIAHKTTSRLQPGCRVISDTWGHILGESLEAKTPVAVSGRVLVYPYQDITNYSIGDCVCSAPDGKVDIMTREEIKEWPDRIIGIVNEIPTYDEWIQTNPDNEEETIKIKVKGRIWIDVR